VAGVGELDLRRNPIMTKYAAPEYVSIIGLVLAVYGAALCTINSIIQVMTHIEKIEPTSWSRCNGTW
jgi:hypothetical protein